MKTRINPPRLLQPLRTLACHQVALQRSKTCIRGGLILVSSLLWLVSGLPLAGQSIIQITGRYSVNEDAGEVVVPVKRSGDLDSVVTVDYATQDRTAVAGEDYVAVSGTLTFPVGATEQLIRVPIINDGLVEGPESFTIALSNPGPGAELGTQISVVVQIVDNDTGPAFAAASCSQVQDIGTFWIEVLRGDDGNQPVTVDYATLDGTALAGQHYESANGTLHFTGDEFRQSIPVVFLNAGLQQAGKTFQIHLANASNGAVGDPSLATVFIQDPTPVIHQQPTPASQVVSLGGMVRIEVSARGALMQWQYRSDDGEFLDIPGAITRLLELDSATAEFAGEYRLIVSNRAGDSVTSQTVSVDVDPTFMMIRRQPIVEDLEPTQVVAWFDYDGDGWMDLFVGNCLQIDSVRDGQRMHPPNSFYHNQRDGTFVKVTSPLTTEFRGLGEVLCADFNNDGRTDLFLCKRWAPTLWSQLFLNQGDGSVELVPEILSWAFGGALRDIDGDGWVDLILCPWDEPPIVYRNLGEGQFEPVRQAQLGDLGSSIGHSASFVDFDNDGRPDVHMPIEWAPGSLFQGAGGFYFDAIRAGSLPGTVNTLGSAWADYDNDGFFDLLTVYLWPPIETPRLHRNMQHPTDPSQRVFENVTASSGLGSVAGGSIQGPAWGDFNNDGHLDLFFARRGWYGTSENTLLLNQGDGTFVPLNVGSPNHEGRDTLCSVWVDYDNDGFLDLFVASQQGDPRNFLYRNNLKALGNQNGWLKVQLDGRVSNRSGIGAVIRLQATIAGRQMWQTRQIAVNGSTGSGTELLAHFGLGDAAKVDVLRVEWPSGLVQELTDIEPNQALTIVETQHAPPTQLPTVARISNEDGFHVTVTCPTEPMSNLRCVLEGSRDLVTWTKVMVRTNETGAMEFSDPHAASHPKRFYRVVVP